mgnify:CR=1 FL=1
MYKEELKKFVEPFYETKDIMHNFSHIQRILQEAEKLAKNYDIDKELLTYGAYLHGIILRHEEVKQFLRKRGLSEKRIKRIVQVARESHKEAEPKTIEGKILHDAHLIEGGKTFMIVKSLITGTLRGQNLQETIKYIEENLLGKFRCYLPESQKLYEEKENFTREFLKELKKHL